MVMLFLSDINDNAPTLQPHSLYLEVCESAGSEPPLLEAEDPDLEPLTQTLSHHGKRQKMWKLGGNRGEFWYETGIKG